MSISHSFYKCITELKNCRKNYNRISVHEYYHNCSQKQHQIRQVSAHATIPKAAAIIAIMPPDKRHTAQHATMTYFIMFSKTLSALMILYNVSLITKTSVRTVASFLPLMSLFRSYVAF